MPEAHGTDGRGFGEAVGSAARGGDIGDHDSGDNRGPQQPVARTG
jgi:hypothetical protein